MSAEHLYDVHEGRFGQSTPLDIVVDIAEELCLTVDVSKLNERTQAAKVCTSVECLFSITYSNYFSFSIKHLRVLRILNSQSNLSELEMHQHKNFLIWSKIDMGQ